MNRKNRRHLEKQMGLIKQFQNSSAARQKDIKDKRKEMGKKIAAQNLEDAINDQRKQREEKESQIVQGLMEMGLTEDEAKARLNYNYTIEQKRLEKLNKS